MFYDIYLFDADNTLFNFEYVFLHIGEMDKKKIIIIGDSLTADIQGGNNIGIDTCWFNPMKKDNFSGVFPTYEISKLSDIISFSVK